MGGVSEYVYGRVLSAACGPYGSVSISLDRGSSKGSSEGGTKRIDAFSRHVRRVTEAELSSATSRDDRDCCISHVFGARRPRRRRGSPAEDRDRVDLFRSPWGDVALFLLATLASVSRSESSGRVRLGIQCYNGDYYADVDPANVRCPPSPVNPVSIDVAWDEGGNGAGRLQLTEVFSQAIDARASRRALAALLDADPEAIKRGGETLLRKVLGSESATLAALDARALHVAPDAPFSPLYIALDIRAPPAAVLPSLQPRPATQRWCACGIATVARPFSWRWQRRTPSRS